MGNLPYQNPVASIDVSAGQQPTLPIQSCIPSWTDPVFNLCLESRAQLTNQFKFEDLTHRNECAKANTFWTIAPTNLQIRVAGFSGLDQSLSGQRFANDSKK